ncbi:hypothetical protein N7G274_001634 [Stereocaulon virgatum]|uniref:Uncharacterized protein n=1 Tax=Stereocaulon virgatum TaxID=373712 RepID=A0ABR4AN92_9LECA
MRVAINDVDTAATETILEELAMDGKSEDGRRVGAALVDGGVVAKVRTLLVNDWVLEVIGAILVDDKRADVIGVLDGEMV